MREREKRAWAYGKRVGRRRHVHTPLLARRLEVTVLGMGSCILYHVLNLDLPGQKTSI